MSKILDAFLSRPGWQKCAIWLGSLCFFSYLFWQFLLKSNLDEQETLARKIESLNSSISSEQGIARELGRFRGEVKDLEAKLKFALQELPDSSEVPELLTSISNLARDAGLTVNLFKPAPEIAKDFYAEVPVLVSVEGTYHQLATFFDEVGHLSRIVNIGQILIKEPRISEKQVTVKADCVITTFQYLSESERSKSSNNQDKKKKRRK